MIRRNEIPLYSQEISISRASKPNQAPITAGSSPLFLMALNKTIARIVMSERENISALIMSIKINNLLIVIRTYDIINMMTMIPRHFLAALLVIVVTVSCSKKDTDETATSENIPIPEKTQPQEKPAVTKTIPADKITLEFPADHEIFSVVVDDESGMRVRNLISMGTIAGHSPAPGDKGQSITVSWDGKNDAGEPLPAGKYRVRGISMPRAKIIFDYAWYNPGSPPWEFYPNSGWGANHTGPSGVATACDRSDAWIKTMVSASISEGASAVFGLNKDNKKVFSFNRGGAGSTDVEYYDGHYYLSLMWHNCIIKVSATDGQTKGFQRPAGVIQQIKLDGHGTDLAVKKDRIAVKITPVAEDPAGKHKIVFLERSNGAKKAEVELPGKDLGPHVPVYLEYDSEGTLYVSMPSGLYTVSEDGTITAAPIAGVEKPGPLHFDKDGNLFIMDHGPDKQVKVFDARRNLLRTVGTKGGQKGLEFDQEAIQPSIRGIATDVSGRLWTTEFDHPRRQVLWDKEGKFVEHFVGNTGYGAAHMAGHEQDSKLAVGFGMLYKIDPSQAQSYKPWRFLSSGPKEGSPFFIYRSSAGFTRGTLFRSDASGKMREYFFEVNPDVLEGTLQIFVEKDGDYRPVAAMQYGGGRIPGFPAGPAGSFQIWTDLNGDELIQTEEVITIPNNAPPGNAWLGGAGPWNWNMPMMKDFSLAVGGKLLKPVRFTEDGAPVYDYENAPEMESKLDNSYPMAWNKIGNHYVGMQHAPTVFHGNHVMLNDKGRLVSKIPFDGLTVQGSMKTPMPPPGKTTGELVIAGFADLGPDIGHVFAWHGNYGQAFVFTEDGIFLTSLFKDVRDNPKGYGETAVKGADWTDATMHQESFGAWFGKQDDGKVRYLFGQVTAQVAEILNLDKAKRFEAGWVELKQ